MGFTPVKNIPELHEANVSTTWTINKGVPVTIIAASQGPNYVTNAATDSELIYGVAAESVASGNTGKIKLWPVYENAVFKVPSSITTGITEARYYVLAATLGALATGSTNAGCFNLLTCDGTDAWGVFSGKHFGKTP